MNAIKELNLTVGQAMRVAMAIGTMTIDEAALSGEGKPEHL